VIGSAVDAIELPLLSPYVAKHGHHGFLNSLRADLRFARPPPLRTRDAVHPRISMWCRTGV
jgi:hypothetical protein